MSYNAGAATDDYVRQRKSLLRGRCRQIIIFLFEHPTLQTFVARTFGEGLRRSTVAHFARKVRVANIVAAKHGQKIQQSHAQSADHVRYVFVALTLRAK